MVAKHGNLSEAARELHVTESVLSRHLKALEAETGLELFDRSSNPMRLTAEGELFLPLASEAGNVRNRIRAFCAQHRHVRIDTVRVRGIVDGVTLPLLREAKACIEAAMPQVKVRSLPHQFQTPFKDIREDQLDIAIEPLSDLIEIHDLRWIHLAYEQPCVVVDATSPLAQRGAFGMDDLQDLMFTSLRSNRDNAMRKHVQGLCKKAGLPGDVPKQLTISPADSYDELFLEGLGEYALMLPQTLAARYVGEFSGDYVARPFEGDDVAYDLCAFYREDAPAYVKAYVAELEKVVR